MFFVMAQIGGLYSFCKMIFGSIINAVQYRMMLIDIINKFNQRRLTETKKQKKMKLLKQSLRIKTTTPNSEHIGVMSRNQSWVNPRVSPEIKELEQSLSINSNEVTKYKYYEIPWQMLSCLLCKSKSSEPYKFRERNASFEKDIERLYKQTDVVDMSMAIKELKYMVNDLYVEIKRIKPLEVNERLAQEASKIEENHNLKLNENQEASLFNQICEDDVLIKDVEKVRD